MKFFLILTIFTFSLGGDIQNSTSEDNSHVWNNQVDSLVEPILSLSGVKLEGDWYLYHSNTLKSQTIHPLRFTEKEGKIHFSLSYNTPTVEKPDPFSITILIIEGEYNDQRVISFSTDQVRLELIDNSTNAFIFFLKGSLITTFNKLLYVDQTVMPIKLTLNTSHLKRDHDIGFSLKFLDFHNCSAKDQNKTADCRVYEIVGLLSKEVSGIPSIMVFCLCFFPLALIKIRSCQKLITSCTTSGSAKKLSLSGLTMMTIWDAGVFANYMSQLCDYIRFSVLAELGVGLMSLYIFMLDLSLIEIIVTLNVREQNNQNPGNIRYRNWKIMLYFFARLAVTMTALSLYLHNDYFKLLLALFFIPQVYENAKQMIPYENILALIGNSSYTLIMLYFRVFPDRICHLQPMYEFSLIYIAIFATQAFILILQSRKGSRFFIPGCILSLMNKQYNYLCEPDESSPESECAICLANLTEDPLNDCQPKREIDIVIRELRPKKGQIMKTPCNHRFHVLCLIEWLSKKPECPVCRSKLAAFS